jgi:hypothetical protein
MSKEPMHGTISGQCQQLLPDQGYTAAEVQLRELQRQPNE